MQKEQLIAKFQELYGEGGEIRTYFAPGRVNLIGEHTDYNGRRSCIPMCTDNGNMGSGKEQRRQKIRFLLFEL